MIAIVRHIKKAELAKNAFVTANLRLVPSIAKKYFSPGCLTLMDLIQEGNLGLFEAVERFDWRRGFKFSTYATFWIKQCLNNALRDTGGMVRIPEYLAYRARKYQRVKNALSAKLGREPSLKEIAESMNLPAEKILHAVKVTENSRKLVYQDSVVDEDNDLFAENFASGDDRDLAETMDDISHIMRSAVAELPDQRQRDVLSMHFGLNGANIYTLKEIGEKIGVTREGVRQIEKRALEKLFCNKKVRSLQ